MANVLSTETKLERANEDIKNLKSEIKSLKDSRRGAQYAINRKDKEIERLNRTITALENHNGQLMVEKMELSEENDKIKKAMTRIKAHPSKAREKKYNFILKWSTRDGQLLHSAPIDEMIELGVVFPKEEMHFIKGHDLGIDVETSMGVLVDIMKNNGLTFLKSYMSQVKDSEKFAGLSSLQRIAYFRFIGSSGECSVMLKNLRSFIMALQLSLYVELICEEDKPKE